MKWLKSKTYWGNRQNKEKLEEIRRSYFISSIVTGIIGIIVGILGIGHPESKVIIPALVISSIALVIVIFSYINCILAKKQYVKLDEAESVFNLDLEVVKPK